jgi:hypothetical protein
LLQVRDSILRGAFAELIQQCPKIAGLLGRQHLHDRQNIKQILRHLLQARLASLGARDYGLQLIAEQIQQIECGDAITGGDNLPVSETLMNRQADFDTAPIGTDSQSLVADFVKVIDYDLEKVTGLRQDQCIDRLQQNPPALAEKIDDVIVRIGAEIDIRDRASPSMQGNGCAAGQVCFTTAEVGQSADEIARNIAKPLVAVAPAALSYFAIHRGIRRRGGMR